MPCYLHRFTGTQPGCLACGADNAFYGGLLKGIYLWPSNIFRGIQGADRPTAVIASKELSIVWNLCRAPRKEDFQTAKQLYGSLPYNFRAGLELGALETGGNLTAGMILNGLLSAFIGRGIANCLGATLGPHHRIFARNPATIAVSGLLTYFSFVNATVNFVDLQRRLLNENPEAGPIIESVMKTQNGDQGDKSKKG